MDKKKIIIILLIIIILVSCVILISSQNNTIGADDYKNNTTKNNISNDTIENNSVSKQAIVGEKTVSSNNNPENKENHIPRSWYCGCGPVVIDANALIESENAIKNVSNNVVFENSSSTNIKNETRRSPFHEEGHSCVTHDLILLPPDFEVNFTEVWKIFTSMDYWSRITSDEIKNIVENAVTLRNKDDGNFFKKTEVEFGDPYEYGKNAWLVPAFNKNNGNFIAAINVGANPNSPNKDSGFSIGYYTDSYSKYLEVISDKSNSSQQTADVIAVSNATAPLENAVLDNSSNPTNVEPIHDLDEHIPNNTSKSCCG